MAAPSQSDLAQGVPGNANITKRVPAPGGGEYLLDANGGVYAIGGAAYQGSYQDDSYLDPIHRNDPNRQFNDLILNPNGGYALQTTQGNQYDLAPEWQKRQQASLQAAQPANQGLANTLYSDPAYLNFIRTSDLGIDTVASQVRRKNAAIQAAMGIDEASLGNQQQLNRESIDRGYESRGMFRSGMRSQDRERSENEYGGQLAGIRNTATEQMASGHDQLANAVADRMRQAGEKGFDTAQMQDLETKNEDLKKRYPLDYGSNSGGY